MNRWADYLISAVQYNFDHTKIVKVMRHLDRGIGVESGNIVNRIRIFNDLKFGVRYKTIFTDKDGKWVLGDEVKIESGFITTNSNEKKDFLGNLPSL